MTTFSHTTAPETPTHADVECAECRAVIEELYAGTEHDEDGWWKQTLDRALHSIGQGRHVHLSARLLR